MFRLLSFLFLFTSYFAYSQAPGCPEINIGNDVVLSCDTQCVTLSATVLSTGATSSYSVSTTPYAPPFPFTQGTTLFVGQDDIWSGIISIPFNFCFFGNTYSQLVVGANGVISFNTTLANTFCAYGLNNVLPTTLGVPYLNAISGAFHDMDPSVGGTIKYAVIGAYPCRTFVVNYNAVPIYSCNSSLTTQQIVLYETTNIIEVYINNKPACGSWFTNSDKAVIGIQNVSGTTAYVPPGRNTGIWSTTNEAWRFTPNGSQNYSINWYDTNSVLGSGSSLVVCPSNSTDYRAKITYTRCDGSTVVKEDTVSVLILDTIWASYTTSSTSCSALNDGSATIDSISGGLVFSNGTYSYLWDDPLAQTTVTASNLSSGIYSCLITDSSGCSLLLDSITISSAAIISSFSFSSSCDSYFWNGTTYFASGTFTYSTTNASGCDSIATLNLTVNNTSSSSFTSIACDSYFWNGTTYSASGIYTYTTTNASGCDSIATLNLTVNNTSSSSFSSIACDSYFWNGITYTASGTYIYTTTNVNGCDSLASLYLIINNASTSMTYDTACDVYYWNSVSYGASGVYDTTFIGGNIFGCDSTAILTLIINSSANISQVDIDFLISDYTGYNISCQGYSDGWIDAVVSGGSPPFIFSWNTSSASDSIYNLSAGQYILMITDNLGCSISDTVNILEPSELQASIVFSASYNSYPISCFGEQDGAIHAIVQGGIAPYSYLWSNQEDNFNLDSLFSGNYSVIVSDANQCDWKDSIFLPEPPLLSLVSQIWNDTCEKRVGGASLVVFGGVSPYAYSWSDGSSMPTLNNVSKGEYSLVLTDLNSCTLSDTFEINTIEKPIAKFEIIPSHRRFYEHLDKPFVFIDNSETFNLNITNWIWDLGDTSFSFDSIVWHSYAYIDTFMVTLTILTEYGCGDTLSKFVEVSDYQLFIPNAFTPNGNDELNSEFRPYGYGVKSYKMQIFNRWGQHIFACKDIDIGWNGNFENNNNQAPLGVYTYRIQIVNLFGEIIHYEGQVELIR